MSDRVVFQSPDREASAFNQSGTLGEWQHDVAGLCIGNSRLILAVSSALAATLIGVVGEDGGGFNLMGQSKIGKSTALLVAASVCGGRGPSGAGGYVKNWRHTANGLEAQAQAHCDTLLCLDEMGQLDAREAGEVAYMLASGQGKGRSGRTGAARPLATWRLLFLSTGEIGLADKNAEAGRATKAGQEVRLCDIPADAGAGLGIFENVHDAASAAEFAEELRDATTRCYGTALPAFLRALVAEMGRQPDYAAALRERMRAMLAGWLGGLPDVGGQLRSVGLRFALIAVAGELATEFMVTGWRPGDATWGVRACFDAWLAARGTLGAREDEQAITQLRDFVLRHGSARFEPWNDPDDAQQTPAMPPERFRSPNRAGWRRAQAEGFAGPRWVYYLTAAGMAEALTGLNFRAAVKLLLSRGFLLPDGAGKASQPVSPPGHHKVRCYVLAASLMGAGQHGDD